MKGPIEILWTVFIILFVASFAEFGVVAATNTFSSYSVVVAAQPIASILLLMLMSGVAILNDIGKR
jgi:hypothetical protein